MVMRSWVVLLCGWCCYCCSPCGRGVEAGGVSIMAASPSVSSSSSSSTTTAAPSPAPSPAPLSAIENAQPCVSIANCSQFCINRLQNKRGESWHDGKDGAGRKHKLQEHPLDLFDPCNLGCCLRTDAQYRECAGRCWYWARADRAAPRDAQYDQFHRCASGCDLRCRWNYAAVPPPNNGEESYLPSSTPQPSGTSGDASIQSALPLSEECPQRHFSKVQALFVNAPDLERLEQQRLEAQLLSGARKGHLRSTAQVPT